MGEQVLGAGVNGADIAEKERLEYLYHYIGYQSIIIKLFSKTYIALDIQADYIDFDWIV